MNTLRRFSVTLVGIVTTCVLSAGGASAKPAPADLNVPPVSVPSTVANPLPGGASARAEQLREVRSRLEQLRRDMNEQDAAAPGLRRAAADQRGASVGQVPKSHPSTSTPSSDSGNGTEIAVVALTALAGLTLGAAGSAASRRLRQRSGLTA